MTDKPTIKTPLVVAVYPKISKPDTYGKFATGKFKTGFTFADKAEEEKYKAGFKKLAKELMPKAKKHLFPWKVDEETGETVFSCSSNDRPLVVDAKNNKLPEDVLIGGGTKMKLFLNTGTYENRLCLYLNAVRVIDLVEYKRKSNSEKDSPWEDEEDGFEFDGNSASTDEGEEGDEEFGSSSAKDNFDDEIPF